DHGMRIPGEDGPGVVGATAWIESMKLDPKASVAGITRAIVVGGGNTAIDAVRELRGLGVGEVTMLYRGTEAKMSGYAHEWAAAKQQGVRARWQTQPVAFEGSGRVQRLRCVHLDDAKQPVAGSEHEVPADLVLLAIGQSKLEALLGGLPGVAFERGRVVVDEHQATGLAGVWAGGDCANGGKEVVNAAAEGKRAALAIHAYLTDAAPPPEGGSA
ncbi:MAG: FAD-dependent oxidoreductase, partial [Myxococcales bacterium]|nr:FAD-dependent oxidoreductase [Myxococcales bacterium]